MMIIAAITPYFAFGKTTPRILLGLWSSLLFLSMIVYFFAKKYTIMDRNNNEDQRPSKMRGVVFPKAKYGVIAAIIIIVVGNIFYYKDFLISLIK